MFTANYYVNNASSSAAVALNAGMDMNSNTISPTHLVETQLCIEILFGFITIVFPCSG